MSYKDEKDDVLELIGILQIHKSTAVVWHSSKSSLLET